MMVVTHEMRFAGQVAHRVVFMDQGEIVKDTTPRGVLRRRDERTGTPVPVENPDLRGRPLTAVNLGRSGRSG